jgi:hypothetical protein
MKTIADLRETLFQALADVRSGKLDLDKARAINDISKTIVETAKVEVAYINVVGEGESSFLPQQNTQPKLPATPPGNGIGSVVQQLGHDTP